MASAMFKNAREAGEIRAKDIRDAAAKELRAVEKETAALLDRIMSASNTQVIAAHEAKLAELEHQKARLAERRAKQIVRPGSFEEKLEPLFLFPYNPLKL